MAGCASLTVLRPTFGCICINILASYGACHSEPKDVARHGGLRCISCESRQYFPGRVCGKPGHRKRASFVRQGTEITDEDLVWPSESAQLNLLWNEGQLVVFLELSCHDDSLLTRELPFLFTRIEKTGKCWAKHLHHICLKVNVGLAPSSTLTFIPTGPQQKCSRNI